MNSDGNIQLINNSDKDSGNTLQLSSRATGKNQKSTVSDCIITTILKRKEYDVLSSINIIQGLMKSIIYNKLVRDNIPEIVENDGKIAILSILSEEEYIIKLNEKLLEECNEWLEYQDISELADLLEVVESLIYINGYKWDAIWKIKKDKKRIRGGFGDRILLHEVIDKNVCDI